MAASTPNTILLEVNGENRPVYSHLRAAAGTIKPGMLIYKSSATQVAALASADAINNRMIALESGAADDPTTPAIDQLYDSGDNVRFIYAQPGDQVYMWIADGETTAIGSVLASSATAGVLTVEATNKGHDVVGLAEEVVAASGAAARCKVRIL